MLQVLRQSTDGGKLLSPETQTDTERAEYQPNVLVPKALDWQGSWMGLGCPVGRSSPGMLDCTQ